MRRCPLVARLLSAAVLAAVALPALPAAAQQPGGGGEQLFLLPPDGWTVAFHRRQGNIDVTELVPPQQNAQDWTEMLVVQMIAGKPAKMPQDQLRDQLEQIRGACEDVAAGAVNVSVENGYDTALRAIGCTKLKQVPKGELGLYKVLKGRDRTYIVQRSWRGAPFDKAHLPLTQQTTQQWLSFMQHVVLCDSRDTRHPCPQP